MLFTVCTNPQSAPMWFELGSYKVDKRYKYTNPTNRTFIMLPPSWSCSSYQVTIMNANNHFANRNQTVLFFQPRFGNIDINGRNSRWLHHDKGPLEVAFEIYKKGLKDAFWKIKFQAWYIKRSLEWGGIWTPWHLLPLVLALVPLKGTGHYW